ncbi:MAG: hypothetical protein ACTSRH_13405, partial [Promethearchaeota archaeon]
QRGICDIFQKYLQKLIGSPNPSNSLNVMISDENINMKCIIFTYKIALSNLSFKSLLLFNKAFNIVFLILLLIMILNLIAMILLLQATWILIIFSLFLDMAQSAGSKMSFFERTM